MLFSLDWLLELCPVECDAQSVASALTARGLTVDSVESKGRDHLLDIDVPANRPDCLGHLGVARELSAAFGVPLTAGPAVPAGAGPRGPGQVRVEIDDPSLCSRYTARVIHKVRIGPSADWVVRRLESCGLRSVNNAVDVSNLVMLQLGQPIHFFDLDRLATDDRGCRLIRVRAARENEILRTLDGVERRLDERMAVIADAGGAVALAGVMGGADSEVGPSTRSILVEAARFDPGTIRATSRRLGLRSDASFRFERGGDPEGPPAAQQLSAHLLAELAGGTPDSAVIDLYPAPARPRRLELRCPQLERLLGFRPAAGEALDALDRLQLSPEDVGDDTLRVTVPSWRNDLEREADLVEEVARHLGYDRIPADVEPHDVAALPGPSEPSLADRSRDLLAGLGFHEALGYSMIASGEDEPFVAADAGPALNLVNPIAEHLSQLRRSILPGLVRAVDLNLRRGARDVRLFEVGRVFHSRGSDLGPDETLRLGLAWCGAGESRHWSRPDRPVDLFDIVGVGEHLLNDLVPGSHWERAAGARPTFHPGRSVHWRAQTGVLVAWGGAVHPRLRRELGEDVFLLEVELAALADAPTRSPRFQELPRVPGVTRDLALVLTSEVTFAEVEQTLRSVDPPAPVRFEAVDRYEGPPLLTGQSSLTVRITLQPLDRTLTDSQAESYCRALVERLGERLAVRIRT